MPLKNTPYGGNWHLFLLISGISLWQIKLYAICWRILTELKLYGLWHVIKSILWNVLKYEFRSEKELCKLNFIVWSFMNKICINPSNLSCGWKWMGWLVGFWIGWEVGWLTTKHNANEEDGDDDDQMKRILKLWCHSTEYILGHRKRWF